MDGNDDYVYNHSTNKLEADSLALQELKSSTVDVLRKAFNLLDTDHSGFIEITEMETLLKTRQDLDVSVAEIMKKLDTDGDDKTLSFTEFVAIMVVTGAVEEVEADGDNLSAASVVSSFSGYARKAVNKTDGVDFMRPLWEYEDENSLNCRHRWAKKIDSNSAQYVVMTLVILDVIAVILEVIMEFTVNHCPGHGGQECCDCAAEAGCTNITYSAKAHHRLLGEAAKATATSSFHECEDVPWHGCCHDGIYTDTRPAYYIELSLHWGSVTILLLFLLQLIVLMALYGKLFWRNIFYIVDLVIIVVSLVLEITVTEIRRNFFHSADASATAATAGSVSTVFTALIAIVLGWRVVRIIHGLYGAREKKQELQQEWILNVKKKFHNRIHNTVMLLTAARHGATDFLDNPKIKNRGLSEADSEAIKACMAGNPPSVEELEGVLSRRQAFRRQYEEYLREMSESLENVYSQMCAHEKTVQKDIHDAEHHNHANVFGHGHGHGHGGHGNDDNKRVHPADDGDDGGH